MTSPDRLPFGTSIVVACGIEDDSLVINAVPRRGGVAGHDFFVGPEAVVFLDLLGWDGAEVSTGPHRTLELAVAALDRHPWVRLPDVSAGPQWLDRIVELVDQRGGRAGLSEVGELLDDTELSCDFCPPSS